MSKLNEFFFHSDGVTQILVFWCGPHFHALIHSIYEHQGMTRSQNSTSSITIFSLHCKKN